MVILNETTDTTTSDSTSDPSTSTTEATTTDGEDSASDDHDPGLVDRAQATAQKIIDLVEPFATLLTAVVQAFTVATLVRQRA